MKFQEIYTSSEHYYQVGIDEESGLDVIAVVITWVAWYRRFFRLTEEEMDAFREDPESLQDLARRLAGPQGIRLNRERFLFSEKTKENVEAASIESS